MLMYRTEERAGEERDRKKRIRAQNHTHTKREFGQERERHEKTQREQGLVNELVGGGKDEEKEQKSAPAFNIRASWLSKSLRCAN